jgi:hypothetical protein
MDFIDPNYDFAGDRSRATHRTYDDDEYPHEHLTPAPYDGILISRAIVGSHRKRGKYTPAQAMRLSREGARAFLRYPRSRYPRSMVMGDCGAFSYAKEHVPPYSVDETLEFYEDGGFTHGCSVDHVIFDFVQAKRSPNADVRARYEITIENARAFLRGAKYMRGFTPLGVIQGWSPWSMADAGRQLSRMGYDYLAVGGLVPLKTPQIAQALDAIRAAIPSKVKLHVLGFGKIADIAVLHEHSVASFDTTSPLKRAFTDAKKNYYMRGNDGNVDYYTAIRIPQAVENDRLLRSAKRGVINQECLLKYEQYALAAVRDFARGYRSAESAVDAVMEYEEYGGWSRQTKSSRTEHRPDRQRESYIRTLLSQAWTRCECRVCRELGVEVIIFRSSNRNKRRGMHNLHVFHTSLRARFAGST